MTWLFKAFTKSICALAPGAGSEDTVLVGFGACYIGICNQAVGNRIIVAGARICLKSAFGLNSIVKETSKVHATHMQHTCNTHATHMQHDTQHEHFHCIFPSKAAFGALSPPPAPFLKNMKKIVSAVAKTIEILNENARVACRVACVLHVCCMCVACVLHVCCMCVACTLDVSFTIELSPKADSRQILAPATIMRFPTA